MKISRLLFAFFIATTFTAVKTEAQNGSIRGRILYSGAAPKATLISMAKDPNCLKINAGKKIFQETLVVKDGGSVRNAFVHLKSGLPAKTYPPPPQPVVLDQKGCIYLPRVQGALLGQSLKITNSDQTLHNIHSQSSKYGLNIAQPIAGMIYNMPLKADEVMLAFKCEVHPWMNAYIGVLTHPFFSVSNDGGAFELKQVPPGKYTVQAWHEKLGTLTKDVEVKAGSVATADFTYTAAAAAAESGFMVAEVMLE